MTPKQVDRAKRLRDALSMMPTIKKGNARKDGRDGLQLTVHMEHPYTTHADIDPITGLKVIAAAEKIIRAELKALGVKLPRKRAR